MSISAFGDKEKYIDHMISESRTYNRDTKQTETYN